MDSKQLNWNRKLNKINALVEDLKPCSLCDFRENCNVPCERFDDWQQLKDIISDHKCRSAEGTYICLEERDGKMYALYTNSHIKNYYSPTFCDLYPEPIDKKLVLIERRFKKHASRRCNYYNYDNGTNFKPYSLESLSEIGEQEDERKEMY